MSQENCRHAITNGQKFDPVDLAMLSVGWTEAKQALTSEDAEYLTEVAVMLWNLFFDLCAEDGYPGVYAYEIAEELGRELAHAGEQDIRAAERTARGWVVAEMEKYSAGRRRVSGETATWESDGWKLVADRSQVAGSEPGRGEALQVHSPCGQVGTLDAALGQWRCGSVPVPPPVWGWLDSLSDDAGLWLRR